MKCEWQAQSKIVLCFSTRKQGLDWKVSDAWHSTKMGMEAKIIFCQDAIRDSQRKRVPC